jgi:uncharacterized protein YbjT (DUF2867 family)
MKIFVVGATGLVGGKVTKALLQKGNAIGALVRNPSSASELGRAGVELFVGDLKDRPSIERALHEFGHVDALITTAYGYGRRQRGDTLQSVDDLGNRHLIDAATKASVARFVFTSVLTADKAQTVPHFYQKHLTEQYLEHSGLPWVSLRPGGFLDTLLGLNLQSIRQGKLVVPTDLEAPASTILSDDVAQCLALAATTEGVLGRRIDLGMQSPTSIKEIASELSAVTGRTIVASSPPPAMRALMFSVFGFFNSSLRENIKAMNYVASGQYVADTAQQNALLGPPPTLRDSVLRWARSVGLAVQ